MNSVAIALNRFGLGARAADPEPGDPKRWLLSQFDRFESRPQALAAVPNRSAVVQQLGDYLAEARMERSRPSRARDGFAARPCRPDPQSRSERAGLPRLNRCSGPPITAGRKRPL